MITRLDRRYNVSKKLSFGTFIIIILFDRTIDHRSTVSHLHRVEKHKTFLTGIDLSFVKQVYAIRSNKFESFGQGSRS